MGRKVYVVIGSWDYEGDNIESVHDTPSGADAERQRLQDKRDSEGYGYDRIWVENYDVQEAK